MILFGLYLLQERYYLSMALVLRVERLEWKEEPKMVRNPQNKPV